MKPGYKDLNCRYFSKPGGRNTDLVLEAVERRAAELEIRDILVATCSGQTAFAAVKKLSPSHRIIAVTHFTGFAKPNDQELSEENRGILQNLGVQVLTCQHAFGGVGRGVRNKLGTYQVDEIMAYTLRTFGQGTKVAIELALMATDAGLIRTDKDVISIGGTGSGADTALVIKPANSSRVFEMKVREIICKPANF